MSAQRDEPLMAPRSRPEAPPAALRDAAGFPITLGAAVVLRGKVTTLWPDLPRCNVIVEVQPGEKDAEKRPSEFALHAHRLRTEMAIGEWRSADAQWREDWEKLAQFMGLVPDEFRRIEQFIEQHIVARLTENSILLAGGL